MAIHVFKEDPFKPATKTSSKLRMALFGPSGSGKTWTALLIAEQIAAAENGKIAMIDTEGKSSEKYADRFNFNVFSLANNYDPTLYVSMLKAAADFGYSVVIIDSASHAWNGAGGVLEIVDAAGAKMSGNKFAGWATGRPIQNAFVDAIINSPIHIIACMRARTEWGQEIDARGKTKPVKIGSAPVQSDEFEYEFDMAVLMDMEHNMFISKSRCAQIPVNTIMTDAEYFAKTAHAWVTAGEMPTPKIITAGDSYLAGEAGKTRLTNLLQSLKVIKEDYPGILQALGVNSFGESTLNEKDLHDAIRKFVTDNPKQGQESEPPTGWANKDNLEKILSSLRKVTDKDLTMSDMASLAGIKNAGDYAEWFRVHPTGAGAQAAIKAAFDARTASQPTPAEKPAFKWTQPLREQFIDEMHNLYRLNLVEVLAMIERNSLDEFASYDDAMNAVYAAISAQQKPICVTNARYVKSDEGSYTVLDYLVEGKGRHVIPLRMYDTGAVFTALGWGDWAENVLKKNPGKFQTMPFPCLAEWSWGNDAHTYATVNKEGGLIVCDTPF